MRRGIFMIGTVYLGANICWFIFPSKNDSIAFERCNLAGNKPLKIAHRGGARNTAENTLEAFAYSSKYCDMLEMDVCETKDGVLVVHHDQDLNRTCGINKKINECNYSDLPFLQQIISLEFSDGLEIITNNEHIPTLESVFIRFPKILLNIELKTPTETSIETFYNLIHKYNRNESTIIGIRNTEKQEYMIKKYPHLHYFANESQFFSMLGYLFLGLLPFSSLKFSSLQIPLYTKEFESEKINKFLCKKHEKELYKSLGFIKLKIMFNFLKFSNWLIQPLVWHLKRRGIWVFYWVCNEQNDIETAIKYGANGVISDNVDTLNLCIREKE